MLTTHITHTDHQIQTIVDNLTKLKTDIGIWSLQQEAVRLKEEIKALALQIANERKFTANETTAIQKTVDWLTIMFHYNSPETPLKWTPTLTEIALCFEQPLVSGYIASNLKWLSDHDILTSDNFMRLSQCNNHHSLLINFWKHQDACKAAFYAGSPAPDFKDQPAANMLFRLNMLETFPCEGKSISPLAKALPKLATPQSISEFSFSCSTSTLNAVKEFFDTHLASGCDNFYNDYYFPAGYNSRVGISLYDESAETVALTLDQTRQIFIILLASMHVKFQNSVIEMYGKKFGTEEISDEYLQEQNTHFAKINVHAEELFYAIFGKSQTYFGLKGQCEKPLMRKLTPYVIAQLLLLKEEARSAFINGLKNYDAHLKGSKEYYYFDPNIEMLTNYAFDNDDANTAKLGRVLAWLMQHRISTPENREKAREICPAFFDLSRIKMMFTSEKQPQFVYDKLVKLAHHQLENFFVFKRACHDPKHLLFRFFAPRESISQHAYSDGNFLESIAKFI